MQANYEIVEELDEVVIIRDIGPWDQFASVSNAAEETVKELVPMLNGRKLLYYDTEDKLDELIIKNGAFIGFRPGPTNYCPPTKEKSCS